MFNNLLAQVNAHYDKRANEFEIYLQETTYNRLLDSWYLKQYLTNKERARAVQIAGSDPAQKLDTQTTAVLLKKYSRENERERAKTLQRLYNVANTANAVSTIDISVEWHSSRAWGYNPSCRVFAGYEFTTGHASGCWYDKESASIANALNDSVNVLYIMYNFVDRGGVFDMPVGISTAGGLPVIDGGCGVSTISRIFEKCGYKMRTVASGKLYNAYTIEREDNKV